MDQQKTGACSGQKRATRKKWDTNVKSNVEPEVGEGEEATTRGPLNPGYEEYLLQLQDRNRMLKKLRRKDERQIELERKEQGFSVYVNGANVRQRPICAVVEKREIAPSGAKRTAKTAESSRRDVVETTFPEKTSSFCGVRAKSAPVRRRGWNPESLEIRTQLGERVQVNAPDLLTGNYEEDFEAVSVSFTEGQLSKALEHEHEQQTSKREEEKSNECSDSEVDELAVSLEDVPELRRSLEAAACIAEAVDTEESDVSSNDSLSSAEEVEEDVIESTDVTYGCMSHQTAANSATMGEQDVVVLSFATNRPHSIERQLSSAKRKDSGNEMGATVRQEHQQTGRSMSQQGSASGRALPTYGQTTRVSTQFQPVLNITPNTKAIQEALAATASETELARRKGAATAPAEERRRALAPISSPPRTQRPSSIPAVLPLTEKTVQAVSDKVKQMSDSQQRQLLKVLGRLEQSTQSKSSCVVAQTKSRAKEEEPQAVSVLSTTTSSLKQAKSGRHQQETRNTPTTTITSPRPTYQKEEPADSHQSGDKQQYTSSKLRDVSGDVRGSMAELSGIEVHVEILSNWGHPNKIGLTEVQFFDVEGKRLWLGSNRVQLLGAPDGADSGNLWALVNGKTKTIKPRFMWECPYSHGQRLDLSFIVPVELSVTSTAPDLCPYGVSRVKIWNYNGSLNEVNAGVREVRMFFGGELVWKGLIRKGCGNQAFDYCTVIDMEKRGEGIESNEAHVVRSQTVILESPVAVEPENEKQKGSDSPLGQTSISSVHSRAMVDLLPEKTEDLGRQSVSEKPPWLQSVEMASQQSESRAASAKKTPVWLRDSLSGNHSMSQPQLSAVGLAEGEKRRDSLDYREDDPLGLGTPFPRSNSEIRLADSIDHPYTEQRSASVRSSRRTHSRKQLLDEDSKQKSFSDSQLFSDNKNHDLEKMDSIGPLPGPITSIDAALSVVRVETQKPGHVRTRSRWHTSVSLEESLQSLEQFRMSDYGRITADMEISGDTLDMFMSQTIDEGLLLSLGHQAIEDSESLDIRQFDIPELPTGQTLTVSILTTWGDRHYVGLNGIEIFTSSGYPVDIKQIEADPADINVLPEYNSDPRVVQNLLDGVNRTRDDLHMWLAPFTDGNNHIVCLEFTKPETIALIRVWNYNKSRIHSYRGARHVQMMLDDCVIFDGEIARACGGLLGGSEAFGDTILFTTDEDILVAVSEFDETFHGEMENFDDYYDEDEKLNARPGTADTEQDENRPLTRIRIQAEETVLPVNVSRFPSGQFLQLNFKTTWGDPYYLGLTGIEVLGYDGLPITLTEEQLQATPRDLNDLPEYGDDCRVLENLVDGVNVTMSDEHMWMVPFNEGEDHYLVIDLKTKVEVSGLRIWNYNKSSDDTFRGAQIVGILLEKQPVSNESTFLLRKGPGNTHFDFGQKLSFTNCDINPPVTAVNPEGTNSLMPTGFVFQFQLISTWGDPYYIGLNGIQFFDYAGHQITLSSNNIGAFPHSVNSLENVSGDVRTPDRLVDGVNDTYDGRHIWLAPVFQQQVNLLYVHFDQPVTVSMVKIWNYSKTPSRGVKEFSVLVDGLLVFHGVLPAISSEARGILPTCMAPVEHRTILFTEQQDLIAQEKHHSLKSTFEDEDFQMTNNSLVCVGSRQLNASQSVDPALRPQTSVTTGSVHWS